MMPPVFCLTCKQSTEPPGRAELVRAHFAEHGIEATFMQGYHGRSWGLDTRLWHHRDPEAREALIEGCRQVINLAEAGLSDTDLIEEVYRRVLSGQTDAYRIEPGHVGLCLSHFLAWSIAWHKNLQEVIICEDDVQFHSGFREQFAEHRAQLPADWQIWYAGHLQHMGFGQQQHVAGPIYEVPKGVCGTHCMLIRRDALPVLMTECCEARTHIDALINECAVPKLKCYASYPTLARQKSADGIWPHAVGGYA